MLCCVNVMLSEYKVMFGTICFTIILFVTAKNRKPCKHKINQLSTDDSG